MPWAPPAPAYAPPPGQTGVGSYADGPPAFTTGALLSDAFARYGADPLRFLAVSVVTAVLAVLGTFASMGSNPFAPTRDDPAGVLGLVNFMLGFVASSLLIAIAEGGPSAPTSLVARRGIERAGWLFLTTIIMVLGFVVLAIVPLLIVLLLAVMSPELALVLLLLLVVPFVWLALRFSLALPATVADNLNAIEALQLSRRVTKPTGVWGRLFAASFLLGLLVLPASAGAGLLFLPGAFGDQPALLVISSAVLALFTPLASLISYSAYRRLVPPFQPSWAQPAVGTAVAVPEPPPPPPAPPAPADATILAPAETIAPPTEWIAPPAEPVAPPSGATRFRVPAFGAAAKGILAAIIVLDVAGVAAVPYVVGELTAGRIDLPSLPGSGGPLPGFPGSDEVAPGLVAFGTSADVEACTVQGQDLFFTESQPIVWLAALEREVTPSDVVSVTITRDTTTVEQGDRAPGTYRCFGVTTPETFESGVWSIEVSVNGELEAGGGLFVQ